MSPLSQVALATLAALASPVVAQLDHPNRLPALNPPWDEPGKIIPGLMAGLPTMPNHWVEDWASIHILDWCKEQTVNLGLNPNDVDTWNVHYDDCIEPWIMCRHRGSPVSKEQIIDVRLVPRTIIKLNPMLTFAALEQNPSSHARGGPPFRRLALVRRLGLFLR
jgi:hypothetical protein